MRPDRDVEHEKLLDLLLRTSKYWETLSVDPTLLTSFKHLLRYLRALPPSTLSEILGNVVGPKDGIASKHSEQLSDQEILSMTIERILDLAANKAIPRREIERIAVIRFGMTRGGLSNLRTRDALIAKLRTLIGNEGTHESISRAATQQSSRL